MPKGVVWLGDSRRVLKSFPVEVKRDIGQALFFAQAGETHPKSKPMKGFGSGVFEVVKDFRGDTFRAVYAVRIGKNLYVLHVFQKKSKRGIKTPQKELDLIKQRLKAALEYENEKD